MAFTYDLETDTGKVRLLIADTEYEGHDFEDDEVAVALAQHDDNLKLAAAFLLNALAANRARLAVSVRRGAVSEDLTRIAADLRAQAAAYVEASDLPLEAVVSPSYERFSYDRNLIRKQQRTAAEEPIEGVQEAP